MKAIALSLISLVVAGSAVAEEWTQLLDKDLSKWEIFVGVPHKTVVIPGGPESTSPNGTKGTPLGLNNDPLKIFKMIKQGDEDVLHSSGQIYAGLSTKEEFENYHGSLQYKWGEKIYEPRLNMKRDSGLLVHCVGKHGAFWNVWLRSQECQIQEGDTGDYIPLAGTRAAVPVQVKDGKEHTRFSPGGPLRTGTGYTKHSENFEKKGEWNTVEVWAVGDICVFAVNGNPNMVIFDSEERKGDKFVPLTKGRLQIQSEAAEIFYKDIKIRPIKEFPAELKGITKRPEGEVKQFEKEKK